MRMLFVSRRNAGRSVVAAALARQIFSEHEITSAGIEIAPLHPLAAQVMGEVDIDVSTHAPQLATRELYAGAHLVVVVCERDIAGNLPAGVRKLHWPLVDPLDPPAAASELLARFRDTRLALSKHLKSLNKMNLLA